MATSTTSRAAAPTASKSAQTPGGAGGGDDGAAGAGAKKSKKKLIIIGVVAVLVLGLGAKETILKPKPKPLTAAQKAKIPPTYGPIVPLAEQTVNLSDGHFLKLTPVIQLKKGAKYVAPEDASSVTPELSAAAQAVLTTYSGYSQAQLTGTAAQAKATAALITALNPTFPDEIAGIYMTEFLMSS